jgi:hypothetical protein
LRDWVEKWNFHLEGEELEELMEKMREEVPIEEEDPREPPCFPSRALVTIETDLREGAAGVGERFWKMDLRREAMVQGFKYPWTRAWPDIVQACRTLSWWARLCSVRTLYPGEEQNIDVQQVKPHSENQ